MNRDIPYMMKFSAGKLRYWNFVLFAFGNLVMRHYCESTFTLKYVEVTCLGTRPIGSFAC